MGSRTEEIWAYSQGLNNIDEIGCVKNPRNVNVSYKLNITTYLKKIVWHVDKILQITKESKKYNSI